MARIHDTIATDTSAESVALYDEITRRDEAPIIIHVNLLRLIDRMMKDTHYRNQFETSISGTFFSSFSFPNALMRFSLCSHWSVRRNFQCPGADRLGESNI